MSIAIGHGGMRTRRCDVSSQKVLLLCVRLTPALVANRSVPSRRTPWPMRSVAPAGSCAVVDTSSPGSTTSIAMVSLQFAS